MSCTIFYKGTLKDNCNINDVFNIVSKHILNLNAKLEQYDDTIIIYFNEGKSEPLTFHFKKKKIDGFCKWNGENPEEFYKIFDMFIEIKPLFKSLIINDDEGAWHEYIAQKSPCKIKLRPLSSNEIKLLERIKTNENNPLNEVEEFVIEKSTLCPLYNQALLRCIVQDFIKIMNINRIDDFNSQTIIYLVKGFEFANDYIGSQFTYHFIFSYILMQIWLSYAFEYKKIGTVKELKETIKGLKTSKLAALFGITSIFLNRHSGVVNAKHSEMRKFAAKYYKADYYESTGGMHLVMVNDEPEKELEMLFSMMDYLGFNYIGVK